MNETMYRIYCGTTLNKQNKGKDEPGEKELYIFQKFFWNRRDLFFKIEGQNTHASARFQGGLRPIREGEKTESKTRGCGG